MLALDFVKRIQQARQSENTALEIDLGLQFSQLHPNNVQSWYMLAKSFLLSNQLNNALTIIAKAEQLDCRQPQIHLLKISCLLKNGEFALALDCANKLFETSADLMAKDWFKLGLSFYQLNSYHRSHSCFDKAVRLQPQQSQYLYNLASSYRIKGEAEQTLQLIAKVIELAPNYWSAYLIRSLTKKVDSNNNHIAQLTALKQQSQSNHHAQQQLNFALAKEFEDCNQFEESFKALSIANQQRRQTMNYNISSDIQALEAITNNFDKHWFVQKDKQPSDNNLGEGCIFITGLPRSGSTLLERILTQHKEVTSGGELHQFSSALTQLISQTTEANAYNKEQFISASANINFEQLGETYLNNIAPLRKQSNYFIDKMPLNYLYLGLIKKALPKAKIVHMTRGPMATCYAIYKTNFEQAYPFSYSQQELAQYYVAYRKLMQHWFSISELDLVTVNYEQLVNAPTDTASAFFESIALEFQTTFTDISANKTPSATASASQIREGIYKSSIDGWKHYEAELTQISNMLKQAKIELKECQIRHHQT